MRVFAMLLLASAGCSAANSADPKYTHEQCQRIALKTSPEAPSIVGAEDLAFDRSSGMIYISAYDRRATEKAMSRRKAHIPSGNIYAVSISAFEQGKSDVLVTPVLEEENFKGGLRPHGLTYADNKLVFVNRAAFHNKKKWQKKTQLVSVDLGKTPLRISIHETHCAANDVVLDGEETLYSIDHKSCGGGAFWEDLFNLKRSGIHKNNASLIEGVQFANGLAQVKETNFALAATRAKEILIFDKDGMRLEAIELSGGPDNLSVSSNGDLVAAVHPSLMRMGLYRKLGIGKAASKIIRVNLETGAETLLFEDKKGDVFSGATIGIEEEKLLIAGSVLDSGVLVCNTKGTNP